MIHGQQSHACIMCDVIHVLYMFNMLNTCVYITYVLHMHFYTCLYMCRIYTCSTCV